MRKFQDKLYIFGLKVSLLYSMGFIAANYTYVDLINYKKRNSLPQILVLMTLEEIINSYIPNWFESEKKAKFTRAEKINFSNPVNIDPTAKALNPAQPFNLKPAQSLNPAHHEL